MQISRLSKDLRFNLSFYVRSVFDIILLIPKLKVYAPKLRKSKVEKWNYTWQNFIAWSQKGPPS